jgi:hypothetical protein
MANEIDPSTYIAEAIYRLEHSVTYAPECEVRDKQTDLIREVLAECLRPALAELERREKTATVPNETAASMRTLGPLMGVMRRKTYGLPIVEQSEAAALLDSAALALVDGEPVLATEEEIREALAYRHREQDAAALNVERAESMEER